MHHPLSRRRFLTAAATGALMAGPAVILRPGWSQTGAIRIGVLEPRSGPVKYVGDKHVAALGYAVEQVNAAGGLLGRKLELVVADSEMKVDVATRRANDLIFSEKVDFLTGLGSTVGKAASQVAAQHKKIFFTPTSESVELTGEDFFDTTFRCTVNTEMHSANDPSTLQALGADAIGHVTASDYLVTVDSPANAEFVRKWRARYPNAPLESRVPDLTMGRYVESVRWLAEVVKKAGSLDTARLIKAWEGARFDAVWGEVEMRACDHQVQTPGYVAEVLPPEKIPPEIRYFASEFPYIGRPAKISREDITQPARETGNKRCA